ncbi:MAG: multifunctional CCA tRNA nucleotidyl transferase/2'3'-cyclic phosphodiesterase/2'nucleotidase/phosphatase [Betaproteobacteria bacterium RIFCSPLOWO2_12_FULL_62_13]|nr:MAG: multifunctional CCA tRNA nucleotidyl transferase/2'3'-cyclic phosphodiesterase/2'nucleotidase/phosphatase [Betaproteobacteria bacterium RIFCSPLOWO2_12_FULL_62_13]
MKIYAVGGAVRDELLGMPVKDRDYVVVGARPEDMIKLGFKPVGKDFPVFLHPETHEEYALARTERKVARGYHGFEFCAAPDVTLEQDLARRDLTINAIARDQDGAIVDPFNGAADLRAGVLRHVSPAFDEDPVRILRVARFAARYGFAIEPETLVLMRRMVAQGEADALVAERVWQEFSRGLMEEKPSRVLEVLRECGALARVAPELDALFEDGGTGAAALAALDAAARAGASLEVRLAALARALDPLAVEALTGRLKAPASCRDLALLAARHANAIVDAAELNAAELLELLDTTDAWRRPERFSELIAAALAAEPERNEASARLERARQAAASVDAGALAKSAKSPAEIRSRVAAARLDAIRKALPVR